MAVNKKKEALGRQRDKTSAELEDPLGFAVSMSSIFSMYSPGSSQMCEATTGSGMDYGSKINDPETWTSSLADDQADYTKTDVDALQSAFTDFLSTLDDAYGRQSADVDDDTAEAWWPDAVPDDAESSDSADGYEDY